METLCQEETGKYCQNSPHPSICYTTQIQQEYDTPSVTYLLWKGISQQ